VFFRTQEFENIFVSQHLFLV